MRDDLRRFGRLWYGMVMRNWTRAMLVKDDMEAHNMEMNSLFDIAGLTEVERGNGRALLQNDVSFLQALLSKSRLIYTSQKSMHLFPHKHPEFVMNNVRQFLPNV